MFSSYYIYHRTVRQTLYLLHARSFHMHAYAESQGHRINATLGRMMHMRNARSHQDFRPLQTQHTLLYTHAGASIILLLLFWHKSVCTGAERIQLNRTQFFAPA